MEKENYYRNLFFIGAIWNWMVAIVSTFFYHPMFRLLGMDDPELTTTQEEGTLAMMEMFALAQEMAADHRANPKEDIVNVLLNGTVEDEPLTDEEFCHFFLRETGFQPHAEQLSYTVVSRPKPVILLFDLRVF